MTIYRCDVRFEVIGGPAEGKYLVEDAHDPNYKWWIPQEVFLKYCTLVPNEEETQLYAKQINFDLQNSESGTPCKYCGTVAAPVYKETGCCLYCALARGSDK